MEVAWTCVGVIVPVLLGAALTIMGLNPPEFSLAKVCFVAAALFLGGMGITWLIATSTPLWWRTVVGVSIGVVVFVGLPESLRWVSHRRHQFVSRSDESRPASPSPKVGTRPSVTLALPTLRKGVSQFSISFGTGVYGTRAKVLRRGWTAAACGGCEPVTLHLDDSVLLITASVYAGPGRPPVTVKRSVISPEQRGWDVNSDNTSFEVVNENLVPVLQMKYEPPNKISVEGIMPGFAGTVAAIGKSALVLNPPDAFGYFLKRLFKYPSSSHPGERDE